VNGAWGCWRVVVSVRSVVSAVFVALGNKMFICSNDVKFLAVYAGTYSRALLTCAHSGVG
jgi:hypothetical protein